MSLAWRILPRQKPLNLSLSTTFPAPCSCQCCHPAPCAIQGHDQLTSCRAGTQLEPSKRLLGNQKAGNLSKSEKKSCRREFRTKCWWPGMANPPGDQVWGIYRMLRAMYWSQKLDVQIHLRNKTNKIKTEWKSTLREMTSIMTTRQGEITQCIVKLSRRIRLWEML